MSNLNPLLLLEYNPLVAGKKMGKGAVGKVMNIFRRGSKKRYDKTRLLPNMKNAKRKEVINRMFLDPDEKVAKSAEVVPKYFKSERDIRIGKDAFKEDLRRTGEDFKYLGKKAKKGAANVGSALGTGAGLVGLGGVGLVGATMD